MRKHEAGKGKKKAVDQKASDVRDPDNDWSADRQKTVLINGRGAQINPANRFHKQSLVQQEFEGLDEEPEPQVQTEFIPERPGKMINEVRSPDVGMEFSANPYQGCEHGCAYCYARTTHAYWGLSPGLDFERKILFKQDAATLIEKEIRHPAWQPRPIVLSGNTDCYQPVERKLRITRSILEVLLRYRHPVGLITKNSLILRDLDLLTELHQYGLVQVNISITTLKESLRRKMEPRTASGRRRLETVHAISQAGIPVNVMVAPVIPGLNAEEIPAIIQQSAEAGARTASMILVRLNAEVASIFENWIRYHYPDRADKVLNLIRETHGGSLGDSRFGTRMKGEGAIAQTIRGLFNQSRKRFMGEQHWPKLNTEAFLRPHGKQLGLF
jgi:DNA repair photolyase